MGRVLGENFNQDVGVSDASKLTLHDVDNGLRHVFKTGAMAASRSQPRSLGYTAVPASVAETLHVQPEYVANVPFCWANAVGVVFTPDRRAIFNNILHPGETASKHSDRDNMQALSHWSEGPTGGRPRCATDVIRRKEGGAVAT